MIRAYMKLHSLLIEVKALKSIIMDGVTDCVVDGGPGSGNFGHAGRPGMVGGSGGGGSSGSGKVSAKKAAWSAKMQAERRSWDSKDEAKKARHLFESGFMSYGEAVRAMEREESDKYLDEYYALMEDNGDNSVFEGREVVAENKSRGDDHYIDLKEYGEKHGGMKPEIVKGAIDGLHEYTGGGGIKSKENADALNEFLDKAPVYDGEISRGIKFKSEEAMMAFFDQSQKGAVMKMKTDEIGSPSSWTSDPVVSSRFAGGAYSAVIKCVSNKSGVPIEMFTTHGGEQEVLLSNKARWTVMNSQVAVHPNGERKRLMITVMERGREA